ncbi:MAG: hypothetical protein ACI8Z1_002948 [Candidatus Azotimanducaceae bacterium]|jgi:hypothetical protein
MVKYFVCLVFAGLSPLAFPTSSPPDYLYLKGFVGSALARVREVSIHTEVRECEDALGKSDALLQEITMSVDADIDDVSSRALKNYAMALLNPGVLQSSLSDHVDGLDWIKRGILVAEENHLSFRHAPAKSHVAQGIVELSLKQSKQARILRAPEF